MFDRDRLREALCVIAIASLHRDQSPTTPRRVFARICALVQAPLYRFAEDSNFFDIMLEDAQIADARSITHTVQRLMTELEDPRTLIV